MYARACRGNAEPIGKSPTPKRGIEDFPKGIKATNQATLTRKDQDISQHLVFSLDHNRSQLLNDDVRSSKEHDPDKYILKCLPLKCPTAFFHILAIAINCTIALLTYFDRIIMRFESML